MLRRLFFNIYDTVSGSRIQKYYQEISRRNSLMTTYSPEEVEAYLTRWGFNPVLEKNPAMHKADIIEWCQKLHSYDKAHTFSYTGGSMGSPLKIPISKERFMFKGASVRYYMELTGYTIGEPYALVKAKPRMALLSKLRNETIILPRDISDGNLQKIYETFRDNGVRYCFGFTSFYHTLSVYMLKNQLKLPEIKTIVCSSEALHPHQLTDIRNAFGCKVLSRYSNEEVGIIAHQRETAGPYLVDKAGVIVEVLDPETLEPKQPGEEGTIFITDLHADLFPLIRYNTGDRAVVGEYRDGQLYSMSKIIGREAELIYNAGGNPISSLSIGPGIYKPLANKGLNLIFQFSQTDTKNYELRIKKLKHATLPDETRDEIIANLKEILGSDAIIQVKFTEELTKRKSGKVPIYLNELPVNSQK